MLKVDGAFSPVSTRRGTGFCITGISPPKRFVAGQLSGGLKILYKHLREKKKSPHKKCGSQTDAEGKFQPCYPVPLLAGRYKFVQIIGQGQSSILVAAEDTFHPDKKPVAVKVMHLDYSRLGAQEADCIQQLNKSDSLNVSRTIQLFNVFSFEGHYCLVFELLRPRPLHQCFQRCQFDNEEAKLKVIRKITLQLLQVLGFLKRENVIHADLKPENILFEEGEEIKIKVVDFGNAIHWVHREVSLYYDEFELQTLLYRAPEVMFGVPFSPEIDMWSLGCILAELYTGKPLFLGRNKTEILQEVTSVFGPIPKNPFQTGKFFQDLSEFVGHNPDINQLVLVTNMMRKLNNSRNYAFASFLVGLLQYNPSKRLTPSQAALHPFLASEFPCAFLLPQQGDTISDAVTGYTDVLLTPEQYTFKPHIDEEIKRQHYSNTELLRRGTTTLLCSSNEISSSSMQTKQNKRDALKSCSPTPNGNSENVQSSNEVIAVNDNGNGDDYEKLNKTGIFPVKNSSYAIEGPLAASQPKQTLPQNKISPSHKEKICSDDKEKRERKTSASLRPGLSTHKKSVFENQNNKFFKLDSTERSNLVQISQKKTRIPRTCNGPEKSSMKLKGRQADTFKPQGIVAPGASSICEDKDKNKYFKLDRTERSDLVQISQKRTRIYSTYNEPEKSSMELKSPRGNTSKLEAIVAPGASTICESKNKNKLLKLDSPVSEKKSRLHSSYNETERTSMKLKCPRADTSQRDSNVTQDLSFAFNLEDQPRKSKDSVKRTSRWYSDGASTNEAGKDDRFRHSSTSAKTNLDLETCSSCDAARTRVYCRKTKHRKTEQQNDLSVEVKCNVVEDLIVSRGDKKTANSVCLENYPFGKTSLVDQRLAIKRRRKKLCQEPLEQDSKNAGSPDKYHEDAVMLL